jgi:alpha-amylase
MGVLLQAFYQRGDRGVPTPADGDPISPWWDHLAKQATSFREVGFTAIWLPPVLKGASGRGSVGYDVYDDYDLGSKDQKGSVETRYGTREELTRCVAVLRANGLDVYVDLVENQRGGGGGPGGFTFRYKDAEGNPGGGRFPKDAHDFHPNVPQDPNVPGPDFSFGADLAAINGGNPRGKVAEHLTQSADWLTRALDLQGYRVDDVKGQSSDFLLPFLNSTSMAGKFAVAEFFDGDIGKVQDWLANKMHGRVAAFDFSTRFTLQGMCNSRPFNMSVLDHTGLVGSNPFQAVTFVENHDTDRKFPIFRNKLLAYAYILTSEGYPCVFYKDYSTDPGCFGLKSGIDNLIFIHEQLANGGTQQRFKDFDIFAYERLASPGLLTVLNNNPDNDRTITVQTQFGANHPIHNYTAHGQQDVRTDANGQATITIPKNTNGLGFVCFSRPGIGSAFQITSHSVSQAMEGAPDLDIKPANDTAPVEPGRIFCEAGKDINGRLRFDSHNWTATTTLTLELLDPSRSNLATKVFHQGDNGKSLTAKAAKTGTHTFRILAAHPPAGHPKISYTLEATYQAPKTF